MKTIKLTGPFSDAEIAGFVELLRRIDDANPTEIYMITVTDPDVASVDAAERLVSRLLPPFHERAARFVRAAEEAADD